MTKKDSLKILFIINPGAGSRTVNWTIEIANYFASLNFFLKNSFHPITSEVVPLAISRKKHLQTD